MTMTQYFTDYVILSVTHMYHGHFDLYICQQVMILPSEFEHLGSNAGMYCNILLLLSSTYHFLSFKQT